MDQDLDREIYESGNAPDPSPSPEPASDREAVSTAIRDMQRGRAPEPGEPSQQPASPTPPHGVEDQSPGGLLRAMLDERDRRQGLERQLQRYQEQEREAQARAAQNQTPFDQRFFSEPEKELQSYVSQHVQPLEMRMQNMAADFDMRIARMMHGEVFDEAFQEWFNQVGDFSRPDPNTYFGVMNSPSPGAALMDWFKNRKWRSELDEAGGPDGYRARLEAEILAKHGLGPPPTAAPPNGSGGGAPAARNPDGTFAPRHEVRLPTSLARAGGGGRGLPAAEEDGSEEAIFDAGRPERRR